MAPPRVFLEVAIGDSRQHSEDVAAHDRALRFYGRVAPQYGWSGGLEALDEEAQEVFQEAYASDPAAAAGPALVVAPRLAGGRLVVELSAATQAPKAVENFRCLCTGERGTGKASGKPLHYRGVRLHRAQAGFLVQGGDVVKGDGSGGDSIYGGKFKDEPAGLKLKHDAAGVVGFANSGKHSNTSQFYITFGPAPQCDGKHVVVGRVVKGLDVLRQIGAASSHAPSLPRLPAGLTQSTQRCCPLLLPAAEELAASSDGTPRTDVVIADCGQL